MQSVMVPPALEPRTVPRPLVSLPRCAFVAALALVLGLAGCGRKGTLDPPPASTPEPAAQAAAPGPNGQAATPGPNGQAAAPNTPNTPPGTPNRKLPIDWLLN